jgi:hypothetical protein
MCCEIEMPPRERKRHGRVDFELPKTAWPVLQKPSWSSVCMYLCMYACVYVKSAFLKCVKLTTEMCNSHSRILSIFTRTTLSKFPFFMLVDDLKRKKRFIELNPRARFLEEGKYFYHFPHLRLPPQYKCNRSFPLSLAHFRII